MHVFVARQPILDRKEKVVGYELLFRDGITNFNNSGDEDKATSTVIANSFLSMGINYVTSGKPAFINFTPNLLKSKLATILPVHAVVIEITENVEPDKDVIEACKQLKELGYRLALDDFIFNAKFRPLLNLADIVKIDFRATDAVERETIINQINNKDIKFLAEKVETRQEFEQAKSTGYDYFQGYYFSKPELISEKTIPLNKISCMELLHEVHKPELDLDKLEIIVKRDVALSYKLLRFVNSSYFGFRSTIKSIKHAFTLLGIRGVRRWVSFVALKEIGKNKPEELVVISYIRATFSELVADKLQREADPKDAFLMGLFSLLDVLLDRPFDEILAELPVNEAIKTALLGKQNSLRDIRDLIINYEHGHWDGLKEFALKLGLEEDDIPDLYFESIKETDAVSMADEAS